MRFASFLGGIGLVSLAALAASGCSSKSDPAADPDGGTGDGGDVVSCDDSREQTYAANMQVTGDAGVFTFVLQSSDPAPPADETNTWVLQVLDASGQPVTAATLASVTPTMPLMSHGTSTPTIVANGDGTFQVSGIYLFMGGLWQVAVLAKNGSQQDTASFYFCVAG
ncbi:MAG TPA: FixH family protein [Polyangiaceae bacterium]|jgi:hypothetical protein